MLCFYYLLFSVTDLRKCLLGVGLLHQRAPKLIAVVGVAVHQLSIHRGEPVIDHYVHPLSKPPEAEVEDPGVGVRFVFVPLLILPVRNHLWKKTPTKNIKTMVITSLELRRNRGLLSCVISGEQPPGDLRPESNRKSPTDAVLVIFRPFTRPGNICTSTLNEVQRHLVTLGVL